MTKATLKDGAAAERPKSCQSPLPPRRILTRKAVRCSARRRDSFYPGVLWLNNNICLVPVGNYPDGFLRRKQLSRRLLDPAQNYPIGFLRTQQLSRGLPDPVRRGLLLVAFSEETFVTAKRKSDIFSRLSSRAADVGHQSADWQSGFGQALAQGMTHPDLLSWGT